MDGAMQEVIRIDAANGPLRVVVSRDGPPSLSAEVAAQWEKLRSENPRHYDGPVLSVVSFDAASNEMVTRRDRYPRLAVQPRVRTGVRLLAVTGVLIAKDAGGVEHVLLGRRGRETRVYAGMWEVGPSGGVACPPPSIGVLSEADLVASLRDEIEEESSLPPPSAAAPVALVRDHRAFSDDIVFRCDSGGLEAARAAMGPANWEYEEHAWLPLGEVAAFDARHANEIIPPTRAIFRFFGWA